MTAEAEPAPDEPAASKLEIEAAATEAEAHAFHAEAETRALEVEESAAEPAASAHRVASELPAEPEAAALEIEAAATEAEAHAFHAEAETRALELEAAEAEPAGPELAAAVETANEDEPLAEACVTETGDAESGPKAEGPFVHPAEPAPAAGAAAPPQAVKREEGPDTSPFSVIVSQVYEGPLDLLLDLIRKQDIDIYDIPIAKITAQFLAYVNQLRAGDMDVAGEFIYTASLLIHIKSKMLLPRAPSGPDDAEEDPRRELVERLLEHERFKNAAQMLQQKQMLEAATWTNPGLREFRDDAASEPEVAADTTDLVRIFRDILERARNRPVINLEEDTVTVGQMIQFLTRRLTMEEKPVALRRLLAHTKSERALIAMFLALLELVRLQAILLRQDRHFSEIFIKKNTGFEAVMNQGLARDDWQ